MLQHLTAKYRFSYISWQQLAAEYWCCSHWILKRRYNSRWVWHHFTRNNMTYNAGVTTLWEVKCTMWVWHWECPRGLVRWEALDSAGCDLKAVWVTAAAYLDPASSGSCHSQVSVLRAGTPPTLYYPPDHPDHPNPRTSMWTRGWKLKSGPRLESPSDTPRPADPASSSGSGRGL